MCSVKKKKKDSKTETTQLLAHFSVSDLPLSLLCESLMFFWQDLACSVWYCHKLCNTFLMGVTGKKPLK